MAQKNLHFILLIIFSSIFIGCSNKNIQSNNKQFPQYNIFEDSKEYKQRHKALDKYYKEWKGVRYKYGGTSKKGVDCSAFVQNAFKNSLNIKIPRTTALQSKTGRQVSKVDLKMGDLVFFRTGRKSRHVGIYLEGGKFMHASTSKGVTISRLDNVYFNRHFWKIQRVIE